jgi:hypothetical protein
MFQEFFDELKQLCEKHRLAIEGGKMYVLIDNEKVSYTYNRETGCAELVGERPKQITNKKE